MNPMSRLSPIVTALFGCLATAGCLTAQVETEREFKREVEVVRALAKDWGFVELAQEHIGELRKSPALTNDLNRRLAEVSAEVLFLGARRIRDIEEQQKVLREAIQKFKDFLVEFEGSEEAPRVRTTLAQACEEYGSFLANRIELEKDPDKRKALEEEALNVFREGIRAANEAMAYLEPKKNEDNESKVQFYLSWLRKGTLLLRWASTVEADSKIKVEEARLELEEMVLEAGEETPLGQLGMLEIGRSYDIEGKAEDAILIYEGTIETIMNVLTSEENPPGPTRGALLFGFAERAWVGVGEIYQKTGRTEKLLEIYNAYTKRLEQFSATPSFNFGDRILLLGARAYFASGGTENRDKALDLAKKLAERHPADFTGIKSKELIRNIVDSGAEVGVEALFGAADGLYKSKKYDEAIAGFKRVLRAEAKSDDDKLLHLRSWALIANGFYQMGRFTEAFYAAREGLQRFGKTDEKTAGRLASLLSRAAGDKKRQTKDDYFEKLVAEAKDLTLRYAPASSKDGLVWDDARNAFNDGKYDEAITNYRRVTKEYFQYELALVRIAVCYYKKQDFASARKELDSYEAFVNDKFNSIPPNEVNRENVRKKAIAEMHFHRGLMLADEAMGRLPGQKPRPEQLKKVVDAFKGFREKYKAYPELATRSSYDLIDALLELEKVDEAELEYAALKQQYPTDRTVAVLAVKLFKARQSAVEAVEAEIAGIPEGDENRAKRRDAVRRLRAEVRKALDFAKTYTKLELEPDYGLLRSAAKLALKINDFDIAREFLRKIVNVYGDNEKFADIIDKFVKPDLAEIDLLDGKFDAALKSIDDALKALGDSKSKLYYDLIRLKAFALAGYRTQFGDDGRPVRQNGLGRFKEAYQLMWQTYNVYIKSKFKPHRDYEWYEFYFDCMDISLKVAGNQDTAFMDTARKFFRIAKSTDNFASLEAMGARGSRLRLLFRNLGPR